MSGEGSRALPADVAIPAGESSVTALRPLRLVGLFAGLALISTWLCYGAASAELLLTLDLACIYAMAALGLTVMFGLGGLLSVAQAAVMAVGGYALAISTEHAVGFLPAIGLSILGGIVASGLTGAVGSRVKSHYFVLATLALAEGVSLVLVNEIDLTGGSNGMPVAASEFAGIDLTDPHTLVLVLAPSVWLIAYLVECLRRSRFGLALTGLSGDEYLANAAGVPVNRCRFLATLAGGAFAGYAGGMLGVLNGYIGPQDFGLDVAILLLLIVVFGGAASSIGTVFAAVILTYISHGLFNITTAGEVVYGGGTVLLLLLLPTGLAGAARAALARWADLRGTGQ